jgi:hypothetical protein
MLDTTLRTMMAPSLRVPCPKGRRFYGTTQGQPTLFPCNR